MEPVRGPDDVAVHAALAAWRSSVTNFLLAASAAGHLPVIIVVLLGYGPPTSPLVIALGLVAYAVIAVSAVLRGVEYRIRLWASFLSGYLAVALVTLVFPRGAYAHIGLVALPILALVLFGARTARVARR
jgi:hypothetical protein